MDVLFGAGPNAPQRRIYTLLSGGGEIFVPMEGCPVEARPLTARRRASPLSNIQPLETVAGAAIATRRLALWLVATFGLTALFLAVVGIYGVMAQTVDQRTHEFGVRQALGATRSDIVRLVFSSSAMMTIAGLLAGAALALGSTRLLGSLLYGVTPLDPSTFAGVTAILVMAAAGAAYLPARRATRISAAAALRAAD